MEKSFLTKLAQNKIQHKMNHDISNYISSRVEFVSLSNVSISQGNAATLLRNGGNVDIRFVANFVRILAI